MTRAAVLLLLSACPLAAQSTPAGIPAQVLEYIDAAAKELLREDGTPGLALAVVADGDLAAVRAYGVADLATRAPVTPATRFLAGSISKTFTAVALLQLQEEGLVDVRRPVADYLPWFKVRSRFPAMTLHHLLTHTAGLPRDRSDLPSSPYTALALRDRELASAPGARFVYSNIGYQLLSLVVEEVEGRPFAESIRRRVLEPMGMTESGAEVTQRARLTTATGHQYLYDDRPPSPGDPLVPAPWGEYSAGDANIVTTAPDLARFLAGLLAQGGRGARRLLQPASFAHMVQRTVPAPELGPDAFYGYGVILGMRNGDPVLWHSGAVAGFRSMLLGDADERVGVVVLMNGPGNPRRLAEYALDVLIAARRARPLPPVIEVPSPEMIPGAGALAGIYRDTSGTTIRLETDSSRVWLVDRGRRIPVNRGAGPDRLLVRDSAWALFPLGVVREGDRVVELDYGGRWFAAEGRAIDRGAKVPGAWLGYVGHYRAQVPYYSNYRVVLRKGMLLLVAPDGAEEPLIPVSADEFRVGREADGVERVTFADLVSGRALRLNLSGTDYYRSLTP
ncbi:MAG TPA: serine hydrolase domain-containing protein [Gemmatimonadales bacterium]|nr:serine hydrolase domain-containing protein [Gemmatimonadales bacterium]